MVLQVTDQFVGWETGTHQGDFCACGAVGDNLRHRQSITDQHDQGPGAKKLPGGAFAFGFRQLIEEPDFLFTQYLYFIGMDQIEKTCQGRSRTEISGGYAGPGLADGRTHPAEAQPLFQPGDQLMSC